jgi:hypothetical protein
MFWFPSWRIAMRGAASMRRLTYPLKGTVATWTAVVFDFCQFVMMGVALAASVESITNGPPR